MGFEQRTNNMYQPWFKHKFLNPEKRNCLVELEYVFNVEHMPAGDLFLCLEQPYNHKIYINGILLEQLDSGYFADKSIRKLKMDNDLLKQGINIIGSSCTFNEETDLEAMYLLGDFGVILDGKMATMKKPIQKLELGDITTQGLPHYAGSIKYHMRTPITQKSWPVKLCADGFRGIALRLHEPGKDPKLMPFEPFETEINSPEFAIELVCSMGNAFGVQRPTEDGCPLELQGLMKCPRLLIPSMKTL